MYFGSDSQSFINELQNDQKDEQSKAHINQVMNEQNNEEKKGQKSFGWLLADQQEDIERFINGDKGRKKSKDQKSKIDIKQAKKQNKQEKKELRKKSKKESSKQSSQKKDISVQKSLKNSISASVKGSIKSISKKSFDQKSISNQSNAASVCWIREDEFDDGIDWSDDEKQKPATSFENFYSNQAFSEVDQQRKPYKSSYKQPIAPSFPTPKRQKLAKFHQMDDNSFNIKSSRKSLPSSHKKAKRSSKCKQPSIQIGPEWNQLSDEDDNQWFAQVKKEEPSIDQLQKQREEQMQQRKQYEEYKQRLYRKKKMSQTRKVFNKHELQELRDEFDALHNQEGSDEQQPTGKPKKIMMGLPKLTASYLARRYGSSPATINNLYHLWRYDPTLSKPLARFDRVFTIGCGSKPPKPVIARQRTQKRIQTLTRLLEENPFLSPEEMCAALEQSEQYKEKIERSGLLRVLRMGDFRRKRFRIYSGDRNSTDSIAQRAAYALHLRNYLARGFQIYFYDEMLVSENYDRENGWVRGDKQIVYRPQLLIQSSIVILGLLSGSGQLLWDARFGDYAVPQFDQVMKGFITAVERKRGPCSKLLVVNPLSYRDFKAIGARFERYGWEVIYLPVHGMELNPFFSLFSDMRQFLRKKKIRNFEALFQQIVNHFRDSQQGCLGVDYVERLEVYLRRAEENQHF